MNKRSETERKLLDALETCAARLGSIEAMIRILTDWDIYADEGVSAQARSERRRHVDLMMESMADLARHYHDEAMSAVTAAYQGKM